MVIKTGAMGGKEIIPGVIEGVAERFIFNTWIERV